MAILDKNWMDEVEESMMCDSRISAELKDKVKDEHHASND